MSALEGARFSQVSLYVGIFPAPLWYRDSKGGDISLLEITNFTKFKLFWAVSSGETITISINVMSGRQYVKYAFSCYIRRPG